MEESERVAERGSKDERSRGGAEKTKTEPIVSRIFPKRTTV